MKRILNKKRKLKNKENWGYAAIAPYFIVFTVFGLYPIFYTIFLSFQSWDGVKPVELLGIGNYVRLLSDEVFLKAIINTVKIWIVNFIPQILVALILSALFTFSKIKGMKFFKTAFYLPNLITAASVGLMFNLLFNGDKSVVNQLLLNLGIIASPISFLSSGGFAQTVVSYIQWWMWFGYTTIIVIAGMTTVDTQVYEAAMVDGANTFQTYKRITLPLIKPTIIYIMITSIIGGMQLFDVPTVLTDGAGSPQKSILTSAMYIYAHAFKYHNYGYASAVSVGLLIIIVILSIISFRIMHGGKKYDSE